MSAPEGMTWAALIGTGSAGTMCALGLVEHNPHLVAASVGVIVGCGLLTWAAGRWRSLNAKLDRLLSGVDKMVPDLDDPSGQRFVVPPDRRSKPRPEPRPEPEPEPEPELPCPWDESDDDLSTAFRHLDQTTSVLGRAAARRRDRCGLSTEEQVVWASLRRELEG